MNRRWTTERLRFRLPATGWLRRFLGPRSSRPLLRLAADRQQHLPDAGRSVLHRLVGVGDLLEWPRFDGRCGKQVAIEECGELVEDARALGAVHEDAGEPGDAPLVAVDLRQVHGDALMGMKPCQPAAEAEALYSRLEEPAAGRIEHHVGATPIGEFEYRLVEVARAGVYEMLNVIGPVRGGNDRVCTSPFSDRRCGLTNRAATAGDQDRLAGLELPGFDHRLPGSEIRSADRSGLGHREALGLA